MAYNPNYIPPAAEIPPPAASYPNRGGGVPIGYAANPYGVPPPVAVPYGGPPGYAHNPYGAPPPGQVALTYVDPYGNPVAVDAYGNPVGQVYLVDQYGNPVPAVPAPGMPPPGQPLKKDP